MQHHEENAKKIFQKSYDLYQQVVDAGLMGHQDFLPMVQQWVKSLAPAGSLLELGCGDAQMMAKTLSDGCSSHLIGHYIGVDASGYALDVARTRFKQQNVSFIESDLLQFLRRYNKGFADGILASYVIHHFDYSKKLEFFKLAFEALGNGGELAIIDLTLRPGESTESFKNRITNEVLYQWPANISDGLPDLVRHMQDYDIPEDLATWDKLAQSAGFMPVKIFGQAWQGDQAAMMVWKKI